MNKQNESELENQENWDYEHLETRTPVRTPRVVVSVAFRCEDFESVSKYAERSGKKVSEFIREAALEKATGRVSGTILHAFGSKGSIWLGNNLPNITQVYSTTKQEIAEPVITAG